MEDIGTVLNTLKYLKGTDVINYCNTNRKIKQICLQYGPDLFGMSYNEYVIKTIIPLHFPTLHFQISLDKLVNYYGSYSEVWKQLNTYPRFYGEIPCVDYDAEMEYLDNNYEPIDPSLPENVKYVAGYHRPILNPHKKITFLFFRYNDKLPTNVFTVQTDEVLTHYNFVQHTRNLDIEEETNRYLTDRDT